MCLDGLQNAGAVYNGCVGQVRFLIPLAMTPAEKAEFGEHWRQPSAVGSGPDASFDERLDFRQYILHRHNYSVEERWSAYEQAVEHYFGEFGR